MQRCDYTKQKRSMIIVATYAAVFSARVELQQYKITCNNYLCSYK